MKKLFMAAAAVALFSSPAFAFHCPADMAAIDEALASETNLSQEELAQAREYRAEGERLHEAGKHQQSVDTLAKAKQILGLS